MTKYFTPSGRRPESIEMLEEKELEPILEERLQVLKGLEGEESLEERLHRVNETAE